MQQPIKLGIIIPCFNEEEVLPLTIEKLLEYFEIAVKKGTIEQTSFIAFVDDGSSDTTWQIIKKFSQETTHIKGLKLSRNFGHQNALIAGLMHFKDEADGLVSMDADLQDDISLIDRFVQKYQEGYEVVYGVRKPERESDTYFKRKSASLFYRLQNLMGINTIPNHADFRFLSRKALDALSRFEEVHLFLRGMVPLLGFRSTTLTYRRQSRAKGTTKYPLKKMILFALDGISSFSAIPLRMITVAGLVLFLFSLFGILWVLVEKILFGNAIQGWASLMISIFAIGGIQMISLGIIGEYIGKIFEQSKNRPRYIIEEES